MCNHSTGEPILRLAVIGAGSISIKHLDACQSILELSVAAVCDLDGERASALAKKYGIPRSCSDYRQLLADPEINAVIVATPTFTHGRIVGEALAAGKHVLCEKPPALTYEEALQNESAAEAAGKILMYGFVVRFAQDNRLLKQLIDEGRMGEIYYAEVSRTSNCSMPNNWFRDKKKAGGGCLMDAAIHQLDLMLYLMGYPRVISVKGYTSYVNRNLPDRIKGRSSGWRAASNDSIEQTVESFATGYLTLEGGKNLFIKAAHIANTPNPGVSYELLGDRGGISFSGNQLKLLTLDSTNYFMESHPVITSSDNLFELQLRRFVRCCSGEVLDYANPGQGAQLVRILNAIYESAETGREIVF